MKIEFGRNRFLYNGDDPCLDLPLINGKPILYQDIFDLYFSEWGKPHNLICAYQLHHLVDTEVLQWRSEVNGKLLPKYLATIFPDFDCDAYISDTLRSYSN